MGWMDGGLKTKPGLLLAVSSSLHLFSPDAFSTDAMALLHAKRTKKRATVVVVVVIVVMMVMVVSSRSGGWWFVVVVGGS